MKNSTIINNAVFIGMAVLMLPIVASAQLNINAVSTGRVNTNVGGTVNGVINSNVGASGSVNASGSLNGTSTGGNSVINVSSQVQTQADLAVFASSVVAQNNNISAVIISTSTEGSVEDQSQVAVRYNHRGYLFGLFPVTVHSTTEVAVNDEGQAVIDTGLPWWSFLVAGENYSHDELEAKLKANATISGYTNVNASAAQRARVAEALIAEVQANATANASVDSK